MATKGKTDQEGMTTVEIQRIRRSWLRVGVVGTTPVIYNRMSEKVKRELLMPSPKKTNADKAANLKHDPYTEYRDSVYRLPGDDGPTYLAAISAWFKKSMAFAALDVPGAVKSQVGRLVYVSGEKIPLYGVPQILVSAVRSQDMNRTPDIHTRAIVPRWACVLDIGYVDNIIKEPSLLNLLAAAGDITGVGDWRTQKGSGDYGQFRIANMDDPELLEIMQSGGAVAQKEAMESPTTYDEETEEILEWYLNEVVRRGFKDLAVSSANGRA